MTLYTKEKCKQCKNVKKYIKSAKIVIIDEKKFDEEVEEIKNKLIAQGAKTMPILALEDLLLAQGDEIIDYLVELRKESKGLI